MAAGSTTTSTHASQNGGFDKTGNLACSSSPARHASGRHLNNIVRVDGNQGLSAAAGSTTVVPAPNSNSTA